MRRRLAGNEAPIRGQVSHRICELSTTGRMGRRKAPRTVAEKARGVEGNWARSMKENRWFEHAPVFRRITHYNGNPIRSQVARDGLLAQMP